MRVAICGAGLSGITTAYLLAREGVETVVVDAADAVGEGGASYANAGSVTVSRAAPWAGPATLVKALKWLGRSDAPLRFSPRLDLAQWGWAAAFVRACFSSARPERRTAMLRLAALSRDMLIELDSVTGPAYRTDRTGLLTLYASDAEWRAATADRDMLAGLGVMVRAVDAEECRSLEPALRHSRRAIAGGIFAPDDAAGDALAFTRALAGELVRLGGEVRLAQRVERLDHRNGVVRGLVMDGGEMLAADAVVIATGASCAGLLRPLGLRPPVYPVKGYSITLPFADGERPAHTVSDDRAKVFLTPMGGALRVAGVAEFRGFDTALDARRITALHRLAAELYPAVADTPVENAWTGLRAMTPDGPPLLGPTGVPGLHINTGHGSLGWTLACGSARVVADCLLDRSPPVPVDHLLAAGRL